MSDVTVLLTATILSIALLLVLVLWLKLHPFMSLLMVAMFLGVTSGMPMGEITTAIQTGVGGTLGFVATVVGLGGIFGQILESSGGTEAVAQSLIRKFGVEKAPWSLSLAGFLVAIPIYFDVGFILLVPVAYALSRDTKKSLLLYAIPLLAGLAVTHSFIPPTPGPVAVADMLGADLGWVILLGAIVGIPTTIIAGPLFAKYISKRINITPPASSMEVKPNNEPAGRELPSAGMVTAIIAIPLLLMIANSMAAFCVTLGWASEGKWLDVFEFIGHPFVALIVATLIAAYLLGTRRGYSRKEILEMSGKALAPAGAIILIIGAGGGFKQMLIESGVGGMLADTMAGSNLPPIVLAFAIAAVVRVILGSATVSMITAAGIIAPLLGMYDLSEAHLALIVLSIASGATILSHVNDSGFWLVGKYMGMNEVQTLRSWTVMETIIGLCGFAISLLLSLFV